MTAVYEDILPIIGVGSVSLRCLICEADRYTIIYILTLTDVYHVLEAGGSRLITLGQLLASLHQGNLGADIMKEGLTVSARETMILQGNRIGCIYEVNLGDTVLSVTSSTAPAEIGVISEYDLWYHQTGHGERNTLFLLSKLVSGLPILRGPVTQPCQGCILRSIKWQLFQSSLKRRKFFLELIYDDVYGPVTTPSLEEERYFLICVDDKSRYTEVDILCHKSEVSAHMQEGMVKWCKLHTISGFGHFHKDRETELTSGEFMEFLVQQMVESELIESYTLQQDGVSERVIQTVNDIANYLLHPASALERYWAEEVVTAVNLKNRLLSGKIDSTPGEQFCGSKPDISHLHV